MIAMTLIVIVQIGIDAGPVRTSCQGSLTTLVAEPVNPPPNYLIEWEVGMEPGPFLVVGPVETTQYRVFLTDLDTSMVYEDTTQVLVHPGSADLVPDGMFDQMDFFAWVQGWQMDVTNPDLDPDGDNLVTVLDWFYFCDFDANPVNTPPSLSVEDGITSQGDTLVVPFEIEDDEQVPSLQIQTAPVNGFALVINGQLRYTPDSEYVGMDSFEVFATDGTFQTPTELVTIQVIEPDTWGDLFDDIFVPSCQACHIDAVSGGLSLATYELAQAGGVSGAGFVGGNPELSPLYLRVADGSMPLVGPELTELEIERIRIWIIKGALP